MEVAKVQDCLHQGEFKPGEEPRALGIPALGTFLGFWGHPSLTHMGSPGAPEAL